MADLGAEVVQEFVDAGASARSADRDGLQALLAYIKGGDVDYVLVHKLDRLARDMAEFYSRNLANEAKKGIAQKAMHGGTHFVAPIGYVNTLARIEGHEVKGVAFDEDKAEHVRWAFTANATGQWSISTLRDELEERGLKSRSTAKYIGTPLNNGQVHRMLSIATSSASGATRGGPIATCPISQ